MSVWIPEKARPVSYTHLRAHETDTSLFVGKRQMCIRDRDYTVAVIDFRVTNPSTSQFVVKDIDVSLDTREGKTCLLYTSPSPRDGHLSIRRQASDVYKRQGLHCGGDRFPRHQSVYLSVCGERYRCQSGYQRRQDLSLIHISEPTRRTPLYSSASVRCV